MQDRHWYRFQNSKLCIYTAQPGMPKGRGGKHFFQPFETENDPDIYGFYPVIDEKSYNNLLKRKITNQQA